MPARLADKEARTEERARLAAWRTGPMTAPAARAAEVVAARSTARACRAPRGRTARLHRTARGTGDQAEATSRPARIRVHEAAPQRRRTGRASHRTAVRAGRAAVRARPRRAGGVGQELVDQVVEVVAPPAAGVLVGRADEGSGGVGNDDERLVAGHELGMRPPGPLRGPVRVRGPEVAGCR